MEKAVSNNEILSKMTFNMSFSKETWDNFMTKVYEQGRNDAEKFFNESDK